MDFFSDVKIYVRKGADSYYTNCRMEDGELRADYCRTLSTGEELVVGELISKTVDHRADSSAVRAFRRVEGALSRPMDRLPSALLELFEQIEAAAAEEPAAAEDPAPVAEPAAEEPAAAAAPAPVVESAYWTNPAPRRGRAFYGLQAAEDGPQIDFSGAIVGGRVIVIPSLMKGDLRDAARYAKALRDRLFDASPAAQAGILIAFWRSATNGCMNDCACYTVYTMARSVLAQCQDLSPARARRLLMWSLAEFAIACREFADQFAPEIAPAISANADRIDITFQPAGHADDLWLIGFMLMPLILIVPLILKVEGL